MAARKVSPGDDGKDVEADDTKAVPLDEETTGEDAIRATLHHLATREPHSFHQTTIYYGLVRPDTPPRRKYGLLAASIGIVFLQCFVATGLVINIGFSKCIDNQDCNGGMFCSDGHCFWCDNNLKGCCETNSTETNSTESCWSENMCSKCIMERGFTPYGKATMERVESMVTQDWLALLLASLVVAFAVFAEMRDCMLVEIALRDVSKRREVPRGWRYAIRGLNFARYFLLLPNIVLSVVQLVLTEGGNVKSVCLNTVAVLFLLEVDNQAYLHGLGERTRMEAEEMAGARVTEDDLQTMNAVKFVCVLAIPGVVLAGLLGGRHVDLGTPDPHGFFCMLLVPLPSMVVTFVQREKASRRKLKASCGGLGSGLAGYISSLIWTSLVAFYYIETTF